MSRDEREAWQAALNADRVLREAWDGFTHELMRTMAKLKVDAAFDDATIKDAVDGILATRQAARRVYAAAGLDPDKAGDAPDED